MKFFRNVGKLGEEKAKKWQKELDNYKHKFPEKGAEFRRRFDSKLPDGWMSSLPVFEADEKGIATRVASGQAINAITSVIPELMGGSADLTPSNNTTIKSSSAFTSNNPLGKYLHFGVREHGMGGIVNGIAYHKGLIPFGATFMVFTDYMRPSIRLSALSHLHSIWIMTHDSVGLGEDGPTHQPIEHLASLTSDSQFDRNPTGRRQRDSCSLAVRCRAYTRSDLAGTLTGNPCQRWIERYMHPPNYWKKVPMCWQIWVRMILT